MITTSSRSCSSKTRSQSSRDRVPPHLLPTLRTVQPRMLLAQATLRAKLTKVRNNSSKNSRFEVITTTPIEVMYSKRRDPTARPVNQARSREATITQRCQILEAIPLSTRRTQASEARIADRCETQTRRWRLRIRELPRVPNRTIRTHRSPRFNF